MFGIALWLNQPVIYGGGCVSVVSVLDQHGNVWLVSATVLNSLGTEFTILEDALDADGNAYTVIECLGSRSLGNQAATADSTVITADSTTITADAGRG